MINQEAFDTFWYFINERQKIYLKKEAGEPKPWSDDPIFQEWKFCNVFRKQDKQTRLLIDNVIKPHWDEDPSLLLFNIFAFRAFNWYETYDLLCNVQTGWISMWNENRAKSMLSSNVHSGNQLTSGAYMIRGREGMPKFESIAKTLTEIWDAKDELVQEFYAVGCNRLEDHQSILEQHKFWGWGPFTCYQIVLDLTYTKFLDNALDINTWCEFGPGAKRGISLINPGIKTADMLPATKALLDVQGLYLESHMPKLTLQDIEFSLCELQKFMRIKAGGKSKERYAGI